MYKNILYTNISSYLDISIFDFFHVNIYIYMCAFRALGCPSPEYGIWSKHLKIELSLSPNDGFEGCSFPNNQICYGWILFSSVATCILFVRTWNANFDFRVIFSIVLHVSRSLHTLQCACFTVNSLCQLRAIATVCGFNDSMRLLAVSFLLRS